MNEINKCEGCPYLLESQARIDTRLQDTLSIIDRQVNMEVKQLSMEDEAHLKMLPSGFSWVEAVSGVMGKAQEGTLDELRTNVRRMAFTKLYMDELSSQCKNGIIKYRPTKLGKAVLICGSPLASLKTTEEDLAALRPAIADQPVVHANQQTQEASSTEPVVINLQAPQTV